MKSAQDWINDLQLQPHPEGGYYKETYRSEQNVNTSYGVRPAGTVIYYLLEGHTRSFLHRLQSDEVWYFHQGCPLEIVMIDPSGNASTKLLGLNPDTYEYQHLVIPAGTWFGAMPKSPKLYTLVSCSVSPGFVFEDFELAERTALTATYPQHETLIKKFTRGE